jgi:SAM-dependent methyltransferase
MQTLNPTKDFGDDLGLYHQIRIGYPSSFVQSVFDKFSVPANYTGVEIGPGSGQLTHALTEALTTKPALLYCVEPDARSVAFGKQQHRSPQIRYIEKTFEEVCDQDIPQGTCDLVIAGDCGHWLDPEIAREQCCRLLKPSGRVMFFNRFIERERERVGKELHALLMQHCEFYNNIIQTIPPPRYNSVVFEPKSTYYRTQCDHRQWNQQELFDYLKTHSPTMQWAKTHEADVYEHVIHPLFKTYGKHERITIPWQHGALTGTLQRNA